MLQLVHAHWNPLQYKLKENLGVHHFVAKVTYKTEVTAPDQEIKPETPLYVCLPVYKSDNSQR